MSRWSRSVRWAALALLLACGDSSEPSPPEAEPGTIALSLTGAVNPLAAVSVRLAARDLDAASVAFTAGEVQMQRVAGDTLVAALFGAVGNQRLLTVGVADVRELDTFSALVLEAVASDNTLLPTTGLQVRIERE